MLPHNTSEVWCWKLKGKSVVEKDEALNVHHSSKITNRVRKIKYIV